MMWLGKSSDTGYVKLVGSVLLWYAFSVVHSRYNRQILATFPYPWTLAALQLGVGVLFLIPLWGLRIRKVPPLDSTQLRYIAAAAAFHCIGFLATVVGLGTGNVSSVYAIKAAYPLFSTVFSVLLMNERISWVVSLTLILITGGVILTSLGELHFSWFSLCVAMASNVAFCFRTMIVKTFTSDIRMPMVDFYGLMSIIGFLGIVPYALCLEGPDLYHGFHNTAVTIDGLSLVEEILFCGLSYYLYNEMSFVVLGEMSPISHAIVGTVRHVVVLLATTVFFHNHITQRCALGSAITLIGVFLYSILQENNTTTTIKHKIKVT